MSGAAHMVEAAPQFTAAAQPPPPPPASQPTAAAPPPPPASQPAAAAPPPPPASQPAARVFFDDLSSFVLPPHLEASSPPEARGLTRDAVRMMIAHIATGDITHTHFSELPRVLTEGDLVVINTSGTLAAEIPSADGELDVHLSTELPGGLWAVEVRRQGRPHLTADAGDNIELPGGGKIRLLAPYGRLFPYGERNRLWVAQVDTPLPLGSYLASYGRPIRYGYVQGSWPITAYQNVYVTEPGSAEMPSAGRPFTPEVITRLVAKGVGVTPIVLHTGVASLEAGEPPYPERFSVPAATARRINTTHADGGRVIAIGTTVVRALETVVDSRGEVRAGAGWTELVVTPDRHVTSIDGMLTGWHEPDASHLALLEAIAGRSLLETSYTVALEEGYLWHEFGDVHLVLP